MGLIFFGGGEGVGVCVVPSNEAMQYKVNKAALTNFTLFLYHENQPQSNHKKYLQFSEK